MPETARNARRTPLERLVEAAFVAIPAAALFSLLFVFDDGLRWLGLFGLLPLILWRQGCPTCSTPRGLGARFFSGH